MIENGIPLETYINTWYRQTVQNSAKAYLRPVGKLVNEFAEKYAEEEWGSPIRVGVLAGMPIVSADIITNNVECACTLTSDSVNFTSKISTSQSGKTLLVLPAATFLDVSSIHALLRNLESICQRAERCSTSNTTKRNFAILIVTDKITSQMERLMSSRVVLNFSVDLMHSGLTSDGLHGAVSMGLFDPYLPLTPSPQLLVSMKKPIAGKSLSLLDSWILAAALEADHHLCSNVMHTPISGTSSLPSKEFVATRHQFLLDLASIRSKQPDPYLFQRCFLKAWCAACSKKYFDLDTHELSSIGVDKNDTETLKALNGFLANTVSNYSLSPARSCTDTLTLLIEQPGSNSCPKEEVLWCLRGDQGKTSYSVPETVIVKRVQERRRSSGDPELPKKQLEEAIRSLVSYKILRRSEGGGFTSEYLLEWEDVTTKQVVSARQLAESKVLAAKESSQLVKKAPLAVPDRLRVVPKHQTIKRQNQHRDRFRAMAKVPGQMAAWGNEKEPESTLSSSQGTKASSDATSGDTTSTSTSSESEDDDDDDTDTDESTDSSDESSAESTVSSVKVTEKKNKITSNRCATTPPLPSYDSPSIAPTPPHPSGGGSKRSSPEGNVDHPFPNPPTKRHASSGEVPSRASTTLSGSPYCMEVGISDNILKELCAVDDEFTESDGDVSDDEISVVSEEGNFETGSQGIVIVMGDPKGELQPGLKPKQVNTDCVIAFLKAALKRLGDQEPALTSLQNKTFRSFMSDLQLPHKDATALLPLRKSEDGFPLWLSTWETFSNSRNWCLSSMLLEKFRKHLVTMYPRYGDVIGQAWRLTHNECHNAVLYSYNKIPLPALITSRKLTQHSPNMYVLGDDELNTLSRIGQQILRLLDQESHDVILLVKNRRRAPMRKKEWRTFLEKLTNTSMGDTSLVDSLRSLMHNELPYHQWGGKGSSLLVSLALELWRQQLHSTCAVAQHGHLLIDEAFAVAVPNVNLHNPFSDEEMSRQFQLFNTRTEITVAKEDIRFSLKVPEMSNFNEDNEPSTSQDQDSFMTVSPHHSVDSFSTPQRVVSQSTTEHEVDDVVMQDCHSSSPRSVSACADATSSRGSIQSMFSQCQLPDLEDPDYCSTGDLS